MYKTNIAGDYMEFFYDYDGLTIKMEYWKKDYSATYESTTWWNFSTFPLDWPELGLA